MRTGCYDITPNHLILGIIRHKDNSAYELLVRFKIDILMLKEQLNSHLSHENIIPFEESDKISFSDQVHDVLKEMIISARANKISSPNAAQMLLALIRCNNSLAATILREQGMTPEAIIVSLDSVPKDQAPKPEEAEEGLPKKKAKASALESYSFDLTKAAEEDKLDPVVGREKEIERLAQILCRRRKNNPILIGEPGVGKSAIVEGLAIRIAKKKISRALLNKRIVSLDIGSIVAGTKFRGQFEERIKSIINELKEKPNIILFIDEMHTLVGAGGAIGSLDAANLLKPALSRGEIQCIGATTLDEYRKTNRGGKGVKTLNITEKTGDLVALKNVTDENDLMIINRSGLTIRMAVSGIKVAGRATQGVRLINIKEGDSIAAVSAVNKTEEENNE